MSDDQLNLGLGPEAMQVAPGAWLFRDFVSAHQAPLLQDLRYVLAQAPWRKMRTPGGRKIQVSMSACGPWGWISDARGYRYSAIDPVSGRPWPAMPSLFFQLATRAAKAAGYANFRPDACLMNRYQEGMTMGMHRDADESCFDHPIVSISLGLDANFRFGGLDKKDPAVSLRLQHGDAMVWGGPTRRVYHGVSRVFPGAHSQLGRIRVNLTFRRAR